MAERGRDLARRLVAELMAGVAAVGLDDVEPLALRSARSSACRCPRARCRGTGFCLGS